MPKLLVSGAINWDSCFYVKRLPSPGEEVRIKEISRVSGGTGANVAVAAARILGRGEVALVGALGGDELAKVQLELLEKEGVDTRGVKILPGEESGQAYILIEESGQNLIASYLGANAALKPEHLAGVAGLFQACRGMILTDPPLEAAQALLDLAAQAQTPVFWDPGILLEFARERTRELLDRVDTLFLNESEAIALLGVSEPESALKQLEAGPFHQVVLKLGARGAALLDPGSAKITRFPALPLEKLGLRVVSTVGCGDAFVGAFAAYRVLGAEPREALLLASVAAGLTATRPETRGSPGRKDLEEVAQRARKLGFAPAED